MTIRHPRAPSAPLSDPDAVLLRAEEEKRTGAAARADRAGTLFEPLVFHTWGGLARTGSSRALFGQILARIVDNRPGFDKDFKLAEILEGFSCILLSQIAEQLSSVLASTEIPVIPSCDLPDSVDEYGNALFGQHSHPSQRMDDVERVPHRMERAIHTPTDLLPQQQREQDSVQPPQFLSSQLDPGAWLPLGIGPIPLFHLPPIIQANDPDVDPLLLRILETALSNGDMALPAV